MLVHIDDRYDKFFTDILQTLSEYKPEDTGQLIFMGRVGKDLLMVEDGCEAEDLVGMAAQLHMHGTAEYTFRLMREALDDAVDGADESEAQT